MTEGIISIRRMLNEMNMDEVFNIEYVTFDKQRKTGGQIKVFEEAVQLNAYGIAGRAFTANEKSVEQKAQHRDHYTRNIVICQEGMPTGMIRKIHPALVLKYNGKIVVP